jgi:hypothetical protein
MPTRSGRKKPKSRAQQRLMFAAARGKVKGISRDVAREFVRGSHDIKGRKLPERSTKRHSSR